jgi:hypothetical protein
MTEGSREIEQVRHMSKERDMVDEARPWVTPLRSRGTGVCRYANIWIVVRVYSHAKADS